jgi:hypothetical protein
MVPFSLDPSGFSGSADEVSALPAASSCAHPVLLAGSRTVVARSTGLVLDRFSSSQLAVGVISVRCGNRRASVCPSCSRLYRFDAYRVVAAGLRGGESVPESVSCSPRLFVTLTAPSFGSVHLGPAKNGAPRACHPHRRGGRGCGRFHPAGDELIGSALDPQSYDYAGQVLFNACAGLLWSRFTLEVRRVLAERAAIPRTQLGRHVAVSFAKVAEFQARGVVHFHAVVRLDGPDGPGSPAPSWADASALSDVVYTAAQRASIRTPQAALCPSRVLRFGAQIDVRTINATEAERVSGGDGSLSGAAVARYVAKYATKSTESAGLELGALYCRSCAGSGREQSTLEQGSDAPGRWCRSCHGHGRRAGAVSLDGLGLTAHARALVETAWSLGAVPGLEDLKLRRWAHMLGYRGHFATKSRSYSVTFTVLRERREAFTALLRFAALGVPVPVDEVVVLGEWRYAGRGVAAPVSAEPVGGLGAGPTAVATGTESHLLVGAR